MKFGKYALLLAGTALLLSLSAFAKDSNQGKFTISQPAQVGSTQLKPGDYKVEWQGSGDAVQVKILRNNKEVATTSGKIVAHEQAAQNDAVLLKDNGNGGRTIDEFQFRNRKETLVLGDTQMNAGQ